jgi:hypothetical protein
MVQKQNAGFEQVMELINLLQASMNIMAAESNSNIQQLMADLTTNAPNNIADFMKMLQQFANGSGAAIQANLA